MRKVEIYVPNNEVFICWISPFIEVFVCWIKRYANPAASQSDAMVEKLGQPILSLR